MLITKYTTITVFLLVGILIAALISESSSAIITTTTNANGQIGMAPTITTQRVLPTFIIRIPPGAALKSSPIHYSPQDIAIPSGTTVAWVNDDPEQPHTVTSDLHNSTNSGKLFNSGIMPYGSMFQHTFDGLLHGDFTYHCEIHPWRVGKVSISTDYSQGHNFRLTSGTGSVFNLTRHDRTLLDFRPTTLTIDQTTPATYNITILNNNGNQKLFSRNFFALGTDLQLELISNKNSSSTIVYGPDFSDPITGAYHVQSNFLKPNADYTIQAEITSIGTKIPDSKISDKFKLHVSS
ncbi:MAG TPA: plastocyanin/azurin family copper-binding protein [Nitrososphaeraceae archaeon]|nr:plastocyanin/azurin family copper-binding protein [Nitrososphaeraceae archaeon]